MVVSPKDGLKLIGICIVACCAVLVCTLFLNYNADLISVEGALDSELAVAMYRAQVATGKVVSGVSGGCLAVTSAVMLSFYIRHYIDAHRKELGILKALGYSRGFIAKRFGVFGLSVLCGCCAGLGLAYCMMPAFYKVQNAEGYFPEIAVRFHPLLAVCLVLLPALFFSALSMLSAYRKLKSPVLALLREKQEQGKRLAYRERENAGFLSALKSGTLRTKKALVFFIVFSAFCFSSMMQMSSRMRELSSEMMGMMLLLIGVILACTTLFLALTTVVRANAKTVAMMKTFGYTQAECGRALLDVYRPFAYLGFGIGTAYQHILLKIMIYVVFKDVANVPAYDFDFGVCLVVLFVFAILYELVLHCYVVQLGRMSVKEIMLE